MNKVIALFLILVIYTSCRGCKDRIKPEAPIEVITTEERQEADTLNKQEYYFRSAYDSLYIKFKDVSKANMSLQSKLKTSLSELRKDADNRSKDSFKIAIEDIEKQFQSYVDTTDYQLLIQGAMLLKKDSSIMVSKKQYAIKDAQLKRYSEMYNKAIKVKNDSIALLKQDLSVSSRRLRRAKVINSVTVPTVVVGVASAIDPKYTIPAIGVGYLLHKILKPKKQKYDTRK